MRHTDMQLEEELGFIERYDITPNELLLIKMVLLAKEGTDGKQYTRRYFSLPEAARGNILSMLQSLQQKQVITQEYKVPKQGETFNPLDVKLNKNFEKSFFKASFEMGKELFDIYPLSCIVNGAEYKLRRVSKKFDSLEQAFFAYGKYIGWNPEKHHKIIELVEAGKRSGYQFSTLDAFIVDNDWVNLEALNDKGQLIDNMRML